MPHSVTIAYEGPPGLPHLAAAFESWPGVLAIHPTQIQLALSGETPAVIVPLRIVTWR